MTTVYVEKGYKRSFDNLTTLLKSGFGAVLKDKLSLSYEGDKIVYGDTQFVMDDGREEISSAAYMTDSGASWFEGITMTKMNGHRKKRFGYRFEMGGACFRSGKAVS